MPQPTSVRSDVAQTVSRACTESAGTVQALAQEVGVSYAALCSWSRGRRQPPPHRLHRLADVLEDRAERLRAVAAELRERAAEPRASRARPGSARAHPAGDGAGRPDMSRAPAPLQPALVVEPADRMAAAPARGPREYADIAIDRAARDTTPAAAEVR
jgi:transcriptional regulator with XRE-family HTH domain